MEFCVLGVVVFDQEVVVVVDEVYWYFGVGYCVQCIGYCIGGGGWCVVVDLGFEQIVQDVQCVGLQCVVLQEGQEQVGDGWMVGVQMQIGNE